MKKSVEYYNKNVDMLSNFYRSLDRSKVIPSRWYMLGSDILDFGCGTGIDGVHMLLKGARTYTAYEPSDLIYSLVNHLSKNEHNGHAKLFTNYKTFIDHVDVYAGQYDYVLCSAVWQHLTMSEQMAALRLFYKALKPGCQALITWRTTPYSPGDTRTFFHVDSLWLTKQAMKYGFSISIDSLGYDERGVGFQKLYLQKI